MCGRNARWRVRISRSEVFEIAANSSLYLAKDGFVIVRAKEGQPAIGIAGIETTAVEI